MTKALRLAFMTLIRDWKSGELAVMAFALLVAVTSLTAVGFFTSRVSATVNQQAGEVLAADLRLRSGRPIDPRYFEIGKENSLRMAEVQSLPSVIFHGDTNALTTIRAVSAGYPLRGKMKIADEPFGLSRETDQIPARGEVWVESRLLARLGAGIGTDLTIGGLPLKVSQVLDYRPDQGSQFIDLAPSVILNLEDLPATSLVQPGSRVNFVILFAGDPNNVAAAKAALEAIKQPAERLVDINEASPQIRSAIDRAGRFLNLASLVSVLLAAVAVAMAARRYAARHLDSVALLKSMGASQNLVLQISVYELLFLAILAAVVGTALGYIAQEGIYLLLKDLVRGELPPPSFDSAWLGLVVSIAVLTGFALPPLLQLRNTPPARVLRKNAEPPALKYSVVYGLAGGSIFAMLLWMARDVKLVTYVVGGAVGTIVVLFGAGWLLVKALANFRGGVGVSWRYGLANISRRGPESIVQIMAFGMGLMVLLLLAVVRNDLMTEWQATLKEGAPNHFLINIRPDEAEGVADFFQGLGTERPDMVPMVRARLTHINSTSVEEITTFTNQEEAEDRFDGESNLTWAADLKGDNRLVEGQWWQAGDGGGPRVSIELEVQRDLDLKLGDTVTYDVAGEPVTATVSSVREVQWDSFQPNFFMVFSPGTFDDSAGSYITSVHLDPQQKRSLVDLVRRYPEVTAIDIEAILNQVRSVMDRASLAVQYVFLFTVLAGVAVLLAAIQTTRDERRYESAMLRTLGASRRIVLLGVAAEFSALGLLSGILAATGATVAGYLLATRVLDLQYHFPSGVWLYGLAGGVLLVGLSGTLATRSVVSTPPVTTLRQG
jgi:putative ABC transport system permease protein